MSKNVKVYEVVIKLYPNDVMELTRGHGEHGDARSTPAWSLEQADTWLSKHGHQIQSRLYSHVMDAIAEFMPANPNGKNFKE